MEQSKASSNDSVFDTPDKAKPANGTPEHNLDNINKGTKNATKSYEMRNFAGSNNSASSLRLESEDFEHISASAIEDIGVQNGQIGESDGIKESKSIIKSNGGGNNHNSDKQKVVDDDELDAKEVADIPKESGPRGVDQLKTKAGDCKVVDVAKALDEFKSDTGSMVKDMDKEILADGDHGVSSSKDETDHKVNDSGDFYSVLDDTSDISKTKEEGVNKGGSSSGLLEEPAPTERRVSFSLEEYMEERETMLYNAELRRASENMLSEGKDNRNFRKHSSGDLHSRLKTRKLLGVGETDDGDVHRSKLSQILGHSDQLYIKLPNGLRIWQIVLSSMLSVMALWALIFPSHFFMFMYEMDSSGFTFPIRLYASALVCISIVYWSTIQVSDRESIRLVLLSSIVFFALQSIIIGMNVLTNYGGSSRWTICSVALAAVSALIGYLFLSEMTYPRLAGLKRTSSNKEISEKDQ